MNHDRARSNRARKAPPPALPPARVAPPVPQQAGLAAAALAAGRTTLPSSSLRALQRLVGNAAVTGALTAARRRPVRASRSRRVVQRYASSEHKDLGDAATSRTITLDLWTGPPNPLNQTKKVTLSYGTVNALLGDLYEGWAQLKKAPAPEVERLAALVADEQAARAKGAPVPAETQWETATAGRRTGAVQPGGATRTYLELAEDNTAHFTPANRERYTAAHKAALAKALEAFALTGRGDAAGAKAAGDEALGMNAEADHFLEDAFAAGHLVNKSMIRLATLQFWSGGVGTVARANIQAAARSDQARIWREIEVNVLPSLSGPQAFALRHVLGREAAISRVIDQVLDRLQDQPDKLANLGAKLVHDYLNTNGAVVFSEADPSAGWRTFGDNSMAKGGSAGKAVAALKNSVSNIELAANHGIATVGGKPDVDAFLKLNNPWRLAPKFAEIPAGQKREVGTAVSDPSWVQDLLRTLVFAQGITSPLYQLLVENLSLVSGIIAQEERRTATRRTAQASAVDALLRKHSKNFAAGKGPDDADVAALARALRTASPDLAISMLDRLEPEDLDDDLALAIADRHPTRAGLVALDQQLLMALSAAMSGGVTWGGEGSAIDRIKTALVIKTGEGLVAEMPAGERGAAKKILTALHAQGDARARLGADAGTLVAGTARDVYKPKDLAVAAKGQPAATVLGVIEMMIFPEERAAWLVPYAAQHSDAEMAALDPALLESLAKHLPSGQQRRRYAAALAAATKAGAVITTSADIGKGAALRDTYRYTDHPNLARRLKGQPAAVVAAAIGVAGHDRTAVAADFVRQLTDDELGKLDPALLHRLPGLIDDATQRNRAQAALTASLAGAAKRSGV